MRIKILKTDERLRVIAGEVYEAKRYKYDPQCKYELIGRADDGYDPECNQYIEEVATEIKGQWMVVGSSGAFVPESVQA